MDALLHTKWNPHIHLLQQDAELKVERQAARTCDPAAMLASLRYHFQQDRWRACGLIIKSNRTAHQ
jgi:hypothetical protein